jgi:hypothetical protein
MFARDRGGSTPCRSGDSLRDVLLLCRSYRNPIARSRFCFFLRFPRLKMRISLILTLMLWLSSCNLTPSPQADPASRKFTYAKFEKIETGMSLTEAETVMGASASKINQIDTNLGKEFIPVKNVTYQWVNKDGSSVTVLEQNGDIIFKMQTGLNP